MELAKMLNVTILACLLILTGCFGLGATDDAIDPADADTPTGGGTATTAAGTAPAIQLTQVTNVEPILTYNVSTGAVESHTGYSFAVYWAVMDVDGALTSAGYDLNLDGNVDVQVYGNRGVANLTVPSSEWVNMTSVNPSDSNIYTTVAFIAVDDDSLIGTQMFTTSTHHHVESFSNYVLTAGDHTDDVEDDAGLMTLTFGNGADLDWGLVQIEVVKDSVPYTCDNADFITASTNKCTTSQHGGAEGTHWEKGETLIVSSNGGDFCSEDCTLTIKVKNDGDVIMSAAVDLK